jgi:hypothetical protein
MSVPAALLTDVRDQLFNDWAVTVTFREVTQFYDPDTGQLDEGHADTPLPAVVGPLTNPTTPDTAARHRSHERAFLIRAADLPDNASLVTSRILHAGIEYTLTAADQAPLTDVIVFAARSLP